MSDGLLWRRLDDALYKDDGRTMDQVIADAGRYRRFDFFTNGGESFDKFKSFIVPGGDEVRVLFMRHDQPLIAKKVPRDIFVATLRAWLAWFNVERADLQLRTWSGSPSRMRRCVLLRASIIKRQRTIADTLRNRKSNAG